MDHCLTIKTIADVMGLKPRTVQVRAKQERWHPICQRIRGGYRYLFPCATLPDDVRAAVYTSPSTSAALGFERGMGVNAEQQAAEQKKQQIKEAGLAAYNALPEDRKAEADARLEILQARDAFLQATRLSKKKGTNLFIKEVKAGSINLPDSVSQALSSNNRGLTLSYASLYRWEKAYQEQGRAGLAGNYNSPSKTSIPEPMQPFIRAMLIDRPHLSMPTLMEAITGRYNGVDIPNESAVRRYTAKWRKENEGLILYITNPDKWRSLHMAGAGNASERAEALNALWEFDSTPADVMLTDGRYTLIGVIDVYSRRAKLLVSPTSKAESVAALTRNAIIDWGVPDIAVTDNGADYVSKHMVRVFEDLGVYQELCPPFSPEKKPHIERFFKTALHSLFELLPGYIGHSVADRKAIESRKSFARRMMDKDSDPIGISLSATELQAICDKWVNFVYHHDAHGSLEGRTPAQVAREWTGPVRRIEDLRALDILLNPAPDNNGLRRVGKKGITIDKAWYNAEEFAGYEGKDVFVLLDRTSYAAVLVFTADFPRQYICRAVNTDLPDVDRAEIAARRKAYQQAFYRTAAKKLRSECARQATQRVFEEYLDYRKSKAANIIDLPRPHESYSTPGLEEAAHAVDDADYRMREPEPIAITQDEEERCNEVIRLADKQSRPALPSSPWEKYEFLTQELTMGTDLNDADLAWMKRYEVYLETGRMADGGLS